MIGALLAAIGAVSSRVSEMRRDGETILKGYAWLEPEDIRACLL